MTRDAFWNGKKVLITGINGFIGGNLTHELLNSGAEVVGLMRNIHEKSYLFSEGLDSRVTLVRGSLTNRELLSSLIVEEEIDVIYHLAAQVEVGVARKYPFLTWETNIRGTYTLLESVREHGKDVLAVVVASSDKAYGSYDREKMPYREDYPLIPEYPYDVSKACADMIARAYSSELYRLPVVVTRFSNIYGPGQMNFSALVPDSIRSALGYSDFIPRSDGTQVRDYLFVKDVARLYRVIAEHTAENPSVGQEVFNAGTGEPRSVRDVVEAVYRATDRWEEYINSVSKLWADRQTIGEIDCQYMTYDKVEKFFGWKPETGFEDGLSITVDWYRRYLEEREGAR